jgi:hypothetical protein
MYGKVRATKVQKNQLKNKAILTPYGGTISGRYTKQIGPTLRPKHMQ